MAIWNAPCEHMFHQRAACEAALLMQRCLVTQWKAWGRNNLPLVRIRVGINTATVLVGNFGCSYRMSYTCLGDGVNLASRFEATNKVFIRFCGGDATVH